MLEKKSGFHYIFLKKAPCCPGHSLVGREASTGLEAAGSGLPLVLPPQAE